MKSSTTATTIRKNVKKKILVFLTGGTICSSPNETGENQSNAQTAKVKIIEGYFSSASPVKDCVAFDTVALREDVLSENVTPSVWTEMLKILSQEYIWTDYDGIVVLHGTDTLAYTASLLAATLAGAPVPVCLVSAQLDLSHPKTNGYINFRAAVELIVNGIQPNVYVVYKNVNEQGGRGESTGDLLVHYGAHLMQCANHSANFYSLDAMSVTDEENAKLAGKTFENNTFYAKKMKKLSQGVVLIEPYVGLKYSNVNLDGIQAILHGVYHSNTVCVERKMPNASNDNFSEYSILFLLQACKERGIDVFLAPCDENAYTYASTGDALRNGARGVGRTTKEFAYVKLLTGVSLGYGGQALKAFMARSINYEFIY